MTHPRDRVVAREAEDFAGEARGKRTGAALAQMTVDHDVIAVAQPLEHPARDLTELGFGPHAEILDRKIDDVEAFVDVELPEIAAGDALAFVALGQDDDHADLARPEFFQRLAGRIV